MQNAIPAISGEMMAKIDRIMMHERGVDALQLMELAGFGVAATARCHCGIDLSSRPEIIALAGPGGNGGDAMVAARLLHAWGARTTVILSRPRSELSGIVAHQLSILDRMIIPVVEPAIDALPPADLIIDGLLGFSLQGAPRGEARRSITLANAHEAPILAIDVPSGLDATSGHVHEPCIAATQTVTLALPKTGLLAAGEAVVGHIWLADIGVPPGVYDQTGISFDHRVFADSSLVRLH